jgi:thiosulfate/3-mercaptopyruvate sulfurtransferase
MDEGGAAAGRRNSRFSPRRQFTARPNPDLLRGLGQMLENLDSGRELVVDARNAPRFRGLVPEPRPAGKLGHIPCSVNMPISDLMDPGDGFIMRPATELTRAFEELDPKRPVVASCGSGVTAAVIAFSAHLLGLNDIAVYDGSWAEWGNRDDTPVETGESP